MVDELVEPAAAGPRRRLRWQPWLTVPAVVAAVVVALLPHVAVVRPWVVPSLQAVVPVVGLALVVLALVLALVRRWLPALVLVLGAVLGVAPALVPWPIGTGTEQSAGGAELTILSLNVQYGRADRQAVVDAVTSHDVDVLVLLEADEALLADLAALGLAGQLPHRTEPIASGGAAGSAILSAHPLQLEGRIRLPEGVAQFDQPVAVVEHPELGPVRVAAVHPVPPIDAVASWQASLRGLDDWQATHADLPLLLAGDFNAGYPHPQFRAIAADLTDTASLAGPLPRPTWPLGARVPAFTAIDHVLVRDLVPVGWEQVTVPGTDHRGIVATVTSAAAD
ncbi:endonuclease/exonuclease/phosphatase family protein [Ruania zhangjianzhongii]|uniref:endonuclease/exonuclease/phosphatase family protein n=1 Tax=Ruania zhangjianzhongii TaxID=2603206 RepID=UPI0011CA4549|nr:endonuclease/exonuclease/phosphatase family protein [Ruania zhangjianzhongii]